MRRIYAILALTLLVPPAMALAAPFDEGGSATVGFQFVSDFVHANGRNSGNPVALDGTAPGLQLSLGYAFTPSFTARLGVSGSAHATSDPGVNVQMSSVTAEGLYYLNTHGVLRPYMLAGIGGYALRSLNGKFDYQTEGRGLDLGGGATYFLSRRVSLDFSARADLINWNRAKASVSLPAGRTLAVDSPVAKSGTGAKVLLGMNFWF